MSATRSTLAQQIGEAAMAHQRECTGVAPESVTVLMGEEMVVVTLREALSPAEKEMARSQGGAARVGEFHRQLFKSSVDGLHQAFKRILGVDVRESTVDMESATGRPLKVLPSGTLVQVFHLSSPVETQTWSTPRKQSIPRVS